MVDTWQLGTVTLDAAAASLGPETISLSASVSRSTAKTIRETFSPRAGRFERHSRYAGGWRLEPTDNLGTVTLQAPDYATPPEPASQAVVVESVTVPEEQSTRRQVTISVRRASPADGGGPLLEAGGAWTLAVGSRGTSSQSGGAQYGHAQYGHAQWSTSGDVYERLALPSEAILAVERGGGAGVSELSLPLRLTADEAAVIRRLARPAAIVTRQVSDGSSVVSDETGGQQTLAIAAPTPDPEVDGQYGVTAWTLERVAHSPRPWRAELTLAPLT